MAARELRATPVRRAQVALPPSVVCDWCAREATPDDWNDTASAIVCPRCLESLAEGYATHIQELTL